MEQSSNAQQPTSGVSGIPVQVAHHDEDARTPRQSLLECAVSLVPAHIRGLHVHPDCLRIRHKPQVLQTQRLRLYFCVLLHLGKHISSVCFPGECFAVSATPGPSE